jgi:hypothetical protein
MVSQTPPTASQTSPGSQSAGPIHTESMLLGEVLAELRVISFYLHAMSGVKDEPEQLRADPSMKWLSNRARQT